MKTTQLIKLVAAIALISAASASTHAISVTLGGPLPTLRTATLFDAINGATGSGNATAGVLNTGAGFNSINTWVERGSVAGTNGTSGVLVGSSLTVNVTSGTWGSSMASGNWTINDGTFWSTYAHGAISLHVGGGGPTNLPDHFIWKLTPNKLTGTWSYDGTGLGGGGLSNLKLYSAGTATNGVPDSGATLILLGVALAGLGFLTRRK